MKKLLFIAATMTVSIIGKAQITLEHTFSPIQKYNIVLFTANGTKHMIRDTSNSTIKLYNTDYTLWKTIPLTIPSGYEFDGILHVSDRLFNNDDNVELQLTYYSLPPAPGAYKSVIINETGSVIFDLGNAFYSNVIYIDGNHKLAVYDMVNYNWRIYGLPGSLPCGHCGAGSVGIPKTAGNVGGSVAANSVPNPGSDEVRISYSLPLGVNSGLLMLSGVDGKVINSYHVSNRDSELKVNISTLPGGMYIYTLHAEGMMPATGKIVK